MKKFFAALLKLFRIGLDAGTKHLNELVTLQQDCQLCLNSLKVRQEALEKSYLGVETNHQKYLLRKEALEKEILKTDLLIVTAVKKGLDDHATRTITDKQRKEQQLAQINELITRISDQLVGYRAEIAKSEDDYHRVVYELDTLKMDYDLARSDIDSYLQSKSGSSANLKSIRERVEAVRSHSKAIKIVESNSLEHMQHEIESLANTESAQDVLAQYKERVAKDEAQST